MQVIVAAVFSHMLLRSTFFVKFSLQSDHFKLHYKFPHCFLLVFEHAQEM